MMGPPLSIDKLQLDSVQIVPFMAAAGPFTVEMATFLAEAVLCMAAVFSESHVVVPVYCNMFPRNQTRDNTCLEYIWRQCCLALY